MKDMEESSTARLVFPIKRRLCPSAAFPSTQECALLVSGPFSSSCTTGLDAASTPQSAVYPPGSLVLLAVTVPAVGIWPGIQGADTCGYFLQSTKSPKSLWETCLSSPLPKASLSQLGFFMGRDVLAFD